jgi:hypothetical protein
MKVSLAETCAARGGTAVFLLVMKPECRPEVRCHVAALGIDRADVDSQQARDGIDLAIRAAETTDHRKAVRVPNPAENSDRDL